MSGACLKIQREGQAKSHRNNEGCSMAYDQYPRWIAGAICLLSDALRWVRICQGRGPIKRDHCKISYSRIPCKAKQGDFYV